jgi:hypothetical protein
MLYNTLTYPKLKKLFQENIMWALSDITPYQIRQWQKVKTKHTQQDPSGNHACSNKTLATTRPIKTRP